MAAVSGVAAADLTGRRSPPFAPTSTSDDRVEEMTSWESWTGAGPGSTSDSASTSLSLSPSASPSPRGDREARKRAEKRRRTALNELVGELTALLPLVSESSRKIDKTGVLRLAAHEIRKEHVFGDSVGPERAPFGYEVAEAALDLVDGFLLTATARGIVVVVSPNVQSHLGHAPIDLLGRSLFEFAHPDDARPLGRNLDPSDGPPRRDFVVRLARGGHGHGQGQGQARGSGARWVPCRIVGGFRKADRAGGARKDRPDETAPIANKRRARRDRRLSPRDNDAVIVALVRALDRNPPPPPRLLEPCSDEYWTRHLVDGRIVHCDRRISLVAGYFADEVTGVSAFQFMHKEDVRWVIIALRQMYDQNKPYGESCYRLASRTGRFMFLRTRGYLEVDEDTKAAKSFVCINSLMSDEDGSRMIGEMKRKYSAIVDLDESDERLRCSPDDVHDDEALEDPQQLEQVIMHLITNLPSPATSSPRPSPAPSVEPLTIIPPKPSTVKTSIEKSLSLVNKPACAKRSARSPDSPRKRSARSSPDSDSDS